MRREGAEGEGTSLLRSASASSLSSWRRLGSPSTPSPSSSPLLRPPSLASVRKGSRSWSAAEGAVGGGGGGRVRVCEGRHLPLRRSQAAAGGGASCSGSGSDSDSGGGFRSPAAKMLKVTVPSCSASSCSSVTASVAPGAGTLVPDYWIDGSNRDALSDFFEVESELGR